MKTVSRPSRATKAKKYTKSVINGPRWYFTYLNILLFVLVVTAVVVN